MIITRQGFAVVERDTHLSRWIEETGQIDHGLGIARSFRRFFGPGATVVDVGAALGDHTVPYAEIVGPSGRVHAFEPHAPAFECLIYNTRRYSQVTAHKIGLSDRQEELSLVREDNLGASHLDPHGEGEAVACGRLDDLDVGPAPIRFIKIDAEGWELRVLRGAEKTILRDRPIVMLEVSPHYTRTGTSRREVLGWLTSRDYVLETPDDPRIVQYDAVAMPREKNASIEKAPAVQVSRARTDFYPMRRVRRG